MMHGRRSAAAALAAAALAMLVLPVAADKSPQGPAPQAPAASQSSQQRHGRLFPPEDLGLLESPDRDVWQKPERIMDALGIADGSKVADVGAGGGWFTVRLARRVGPNGIVYAQDVQPQMLEAIERRVAKEDLHNVVTIHGTPTDPNLPEGSLDAVLIVETFHEIQSGNPRLFIENVRRALREGGRVGVVDYKQGGGGPGPDGARPDPAAVEAVAREAGLRLLERETFLPFQFFLIFGR